MSSERYFFSSGNSKGGLNVGGADGTALGTGAAGSVAEADVDSVGFGRSLAGGAGTMTFALSQE